MVVNKRYSRYLTDDAAKRGQLNILLKPETIRNRCMSLLNAGRKNSLLYFKVNDKKVTTCIDVISEVTKKNYPNLKIPYHSRWRNLEQFSSEFLEFITKGKTNKFFNCRAAVDFVFVSVLIDSGAGNNWKYVDSVSGQVYSRSEGLALSSLRMFESGMFSMDPDNCWRVDSAALKQFDERTFLDGMQGTKENHLEGFESRFKILRNLGDVLHQISGGQGMRPSDLVLELVEENTIDLTQVLEALLRVLAPIWPLGEKLSGQHLGDVGRHSLIVTSDVTTGLVPIHKLSQWLVYSLIEPLECAGIDIFGVENLTGLGEYRNGGLLIDTGVLEFIDPTSRQIITEPSSELVVEWRALTIAILDELVPRVACALGIGENEFSLPMFLQGGSWSAGRFLAYQRSKDGEPPIKLRNTGAVF
jgi:hypothetical protein